jgi:hypothetical protein
VTRRNVFGLAATSTFLVVAGLATTAQEVVEIRLRARYFSEPATVRITVAVEPDADNRVLQIEADGEAMFRSTQVRLSGAHAKRLHTIEFKNLLAGQYIVRAHVLSNVDVRGSAEDTLVVGDPADVP